ncbi:MAG: hypothetical protein LBQ60_06325 [Bacteroidales bacterium]|jgi:O-antigen/teichoic acid export membrane protein|nr:hypothetical protein [Bacteroidales bacterium]
MKTFFNYLYYRTSKFYEEWGEKSGYVAGSIVVFLSFGFICLSLCIFVLYIFDKKINNYIVWAIVIIFCVLSLFFINKRKFAELSEKYKDEQNSKLKGWLVFSYLIGSVILFFVSLSFCGYWVSIEI